MTCLDLTGIGWRVGIARGAVPVVSALLLLALSACASSRAPTLRWQQLEPQEGALRVVMAPVNLAVPLDAALGDAAGPVEAELIRYCRERGARVGVIWSDDARSVWRRVFLKLQRSAEAPPDLISVAGAFARVVADEADFDLLVLPALVYRKARAKGDYAYWDGVRRRIRSVEVRAEAGASLESPQWHGDMAAVSLHVLVLTPEGRPTHQAWGGLDLVHDAVRSGGGSASHVGFLRPRDEPLREVEHLREGIARALDASVGAPLP
jgi:hypothetical protein